MFVHQGLQMLCVLEGGKRQDTFNPHLMNNFCWECGGQVLYFPLSLSDVTLVFVGREWWESQCVFPAFLSVQ